MGANGFSKTKIIAVPHGACWAMAFAAIEVFPKECMGGVSLASRHGAVAVAGFAASYQLARRTPDEVSSNSSDFFGGIMDKLADFHSHPHVGRETEITEPSEMDLKNMLDGDVEIIVSIGRKRSCMKKAMRSRHGTITGSVGRFRLAINAFVRIGEGTGKDIEYGKVMLAVL
jgi:hypothetical protein